MGERDDAKHQVEQTRARMSEIAHEVSRRMTPDYAKEQAKERAREMARHGATQVKERAVESSWLLPLLGAGIGALVGRAVMTRAQEQRGHDGARFDGGRYGYDARFDSGYDTRYGRWGDDRYRADSPYTEGGRGYMGAEAYAEGTSSAFSGDESSEGKGVGERATELKDQATAKVGEVKERMMERASHLRERFPDREYIRESAHEQPGMWALGAMALGALFGFAVPVSESERRMIEPAKDKLRQAGEQALDKASEAMDATGGQQRDEQRTSEFGSGSSLGGSTTSLGGSGTSTIGGGSGTSSDPLH